MSHWNWADNRDEALAAVEYWQYPKLRVSPERWGEVSSQVDSLVAQLGQVTVDEWFRLVWQLELMTPCCCGHTNHGDAAEQVARYTTIPSELAAKIAEVKQSWSATDDPWATPAS